MSDYKRFVAYLYEYHNQTKGENRGFVRVEARNGTCQMVFQMKVFSLPENASLNVYGFVRIRDSLFGIPIGILKAGKNGITGRLMTPSVHIGDSSFSLKELGGLLLFGPENRIYATQWDDIPIQPEQFTIDTSILPEPTAVRDEAQTDRAESTPDKKEETEEEELHITSVEAAASAPGIQPIQPSPGPILEPPLTLQDRWQMLLDTCPHIRPFDDDEISECIKIDLKDLPALRKNGWQIGSSQFLLHGFYNYHHLMMGRLTSAPFDTILLGIPGIFDVKEQFMAGMFGFSGFKPARNSQENAGPSPFGYWYRPVQ